MTRFNLGWLVAVPTVIIAGLTFVLAAPRPKAKDHDYELVELVVEVLAEVDQKFVRELTLEQKRKFVTDMINGGLERLDPYSEFFDIDTYAQFEKQTKGEFGGVGILIDLDRQTGYFQVTSPIPGTPAFEAGILAGDWLIKVDGRPIDTSRREELIRAIQGPPGTPVTLTILREGSKEPLEFTIQRARIEAPSVMGDRRKTDQLTEWDWLIDRQAGIAYIRLVAFNEHSVQDLKKAIEQAQSEGAQALILDLRDNPGGLLTQAVEVCDLFLESGAIVATRDRRGRGKSYEAKASGTLLRPANRHPMAVLVNRFSASASEIVAAALQDNKRAVIIGERTYGKGSVQNVIELGEREPRMALKLTTSIYTRPSGANIHRLPDMKDNDDWGVKPNPGFEISLEENERLRYLRWRRQRDVVAGKPELLGNKPPNGPREPDSFTDRYVERALKYLREQLAR
jgi:carboxyl-terminal processing protease